MSQIIIMAAILIYLAAMLGVGFYCSKQNNSVDGAGGGVFRQKGQRQKQR